MFARTHYMPAFSRLGPLRPALLDSEAWGRRPSLFEYWGREACCCRCEPQPLLRWRMADGRDPHLRRKTGLSEFDNERKGYIDEVLAEIGRRGPVTGGDFAPEGPRKSGWWEWSDGKLALEWLFRAGLITMKTRRGFERVYDLTERVIPTCDPGAADADESGRPARTGAHRGAKLGRRHRRRPRRLFPSPTQADVQPPAPPSWSRPASWRR